MGSFFSKAKAKAKAKENQMRREELHFCGCAPSSLFPIEESPSAQYHRRQSMDDDM
jgi:hypothetical protein